MTSLEKKGMLLATNYVPCDSDIDEVSDDVSSNDSLVEP